MHIMKAGFQILLKSVGTKAAIAITSVAVTATSGAMVVGVYQAVKYSQKTHQEQAANLDQENTVDKTDDQEQPNNNLITGDMAAGVDNSIITPVPENETLNSDDPNQSSGEDYTQGEDLAQRDESKAQTDRKQKKADNQKLAVQREKRLAAAAQPSTSTIPLAPVSIKWPIQPQNSSTSGTGTQASQNTQSSGQGNKNTGLPNQQDQPKDQPLQKSLINAKAKLIEPAVLAGSRHSIVVGTSYITDDTAAQPKKKYTMMVYLCGTDLESGTSDDPKGSDATKDLINMLSSSYDLKNMNVIVCAGGTTTWKNQYMGADTTNDNCDNDGVRFNIYELNPDAVDESIDKRIVRGIEYKDAQGNTHATEVNKIINSETMKLLGSYDAIDMGQDQLLAGFVNLCTDYYPAEHYGTILWNHGGGVNSGVCFSESTVGFDGTGLTSGELESALASTKLYNGGGKFDFIGFDACLMGSTELAYNLSPYCEYMIGHSEITAGGWNYHEIFNDISVKTANLTSESSKEIAKMIVDRYQESHKGYDDSVASVACYDSSLMQKAATAINESASEILKLYQMDQGSSSQLQAVCYRAIKQARVRAFTMTRWNKVTRGQVTNDCVDLKDFYRTLKEEFTTLKTSYIDQGEVIDQIDKICTSIDTVLAQRYVIASAIAYSQADLYYWRNGVADEANASYPEYWSTLRGAQLWGTSLYMPYYDREDSQYTQEYKDMKILPEYTELISKYSQAATADQARITRLAAEIKYQDVVKDSDAITMNTAQIGTNAKRVIQLSLKDTYTAGKGTYTDETLGELSSNDPFIDFMDTIDTATVYVSRYQETDSTAKTGINILYGKQDVMYSQISPDNKAINILTDTLEKLYGYEVWGFRYEGQDDEGQDIVSTQAISDWAYMKDVYDWRDELQNLDPAYDYDDNKWISFYGKVGKVVTDDDSSNTEYTDSYLHFYESEKGKYIFTAASCKTPEGSAQSWNTISKDTLENQYNLIQFYHYMVDAKNGVETIIENEATGFSTPSFVSNSTLNIYQHDLMYNNEKYNDYTIGFSSIEGKKDDGEGNLVDAKANYIMPSGQCKEDENQYKENDLQVGHVYPSTPVMPTSEPEEEPNLSSEDEDLKASAPSEQAVMEQNADPETESETDPETDLQTVVDQPVVTQPTIDTVSSIEPSTVDQTSTEPTVADQTQTDQTQTDQPSEDQPSDSTPTPEPAPIEAVPSSETNVIEMTLAVEPAA